MGFLGFGGTLLRVRIKRLMVTFRGLEFREFRSLADTGSCTVLTAFFGDIEMPT